jgi:hypothetical protein
MEKEIDRLMPELQVEGFRAADKVRSMSEDVASWFKRDLGQASQTSSTAQK